MSLFDVIDGVSTSKVDKWEEIGDGNYIPFMINRGLSLHMDCVMLANVMNQHPNIPKRWQYDFYRIAINPKKKRFAKWPKPEIEGEIDLISKHFQVNRTKAIAIRELLNSDQINSIRTITDRGGR